MTIIRVKLCWLEKSGTVKLRDIEIARMAE